MRLLKTLGITILLLHLFLKVQPITAQAQSLTAFEFTDFTVGSNKVAGLPFTVTITAKDEFDSTLTTFNNSITLTDDTNTIYPTATSNFVSGVWTGQVYITQAYTDDIITATYLTISDNSNAFAIDPDTRQKFLTIISGNNQSALVGTQLNNALTMRVVDPYGNALPNIGVNYAIGSFPPGSTTQVLTNYTTTSNALGNASTALTLGRKAGTYIVTGTLTSGITNAVNFYENGVSGVLLSLSISPSVGIVPAGSYLPFTAKGFDQYNNEVIPTALSWAVQHGGGTIDQNGIFYAGTTLGTYNNTVRATSGSIGATATVTLVGAAGEAGGTATSSGATLPTPVPSQTPAPPPTPPDGILYDVQVDPSVISALEDITIPVLAQGVDAYGQSVSGVTYDFAVSGNLGTITVTSAGQALLTTTAGGLGSLTVTATQGDIVRSTTIAGSVGNGLNRRLVIEEVPSPQTVGVPFTISIAAKDVSNNFITDYEGPIVIADTTGTIDPAVVQPSADGIWYVQVIISLSNAEVTITTAGDGMVGVSNIFEVVGDPKQSEVGLNLGAFGGGEGAGAILGASISAILDKLLLEKDLNKYSLFRYIGSGIAAGFGILGVSIGGGIFISRALEALGRNPYAKPKLQVNLYASLLSFIIAASLAVLASYLILQ